MPESLNTTPFPPQSVLRVPSHNSWRNNFCFWTAIHDFNRHLDCFLAKLSFQKSEKGRLYGYTNIHTHLFQLLFSLNNSYAKKALRDHRLHTLRPWKEKLWLPDIQRMCVTMDLHGQWIVVLFGWIVKTVIATPRTAAMIVMMIEWMILMIA